MSIEYVRADLCAMPEALVERIKREQFSPLGDLNNAMARALSSHMLLRDILAWHEGQKGEQG